MSWASKRFSTATPEETQQQPQSSGWASQRFGQTPNAPRPESTGTEVEGVPYPVAPADAFGLPEGAEPSFVTRMAEGVGELADIAMGPARGPQSSPEEQAAHRQQTDQLRKDLVAGVESNLVTRAVGRGGVAAGNFLVNVPVLRPLQALGVESAGEAAENNNRFLTELQNRDSRLNDQGWIAQNLGKGVARGADSIVQSLTEGALGGLVGKAAGGAKAAQKAMMVYFGASGADQALTEAEDFRFADGSQMSTVGKLGYAAGMGALEAVFMYAGGKAAKKFGLETVEEAMFPTLRREVSNLLSRTGVKDGLKQLAKGAGGAAIEAVEEGSTTASQKVWNEIFKSNDDELVNNVKEVFTPGSKKSMWGDVAFAMATGGAARGSVGIANQITAGLDATMRQLPGVIERVKQQQTAKGKGTTAEPEAEAPAEAPVAAAPVESAAATPVEPVAAPPAAGPVETTAPPVAPPAAPPAAPPDAPRVPPSDANAPPPGELPVQIKNARMNQLAREFGRGQSVYSPERQNFRQWAQQAIEVGVPDRALDISYEIKANPRPLTKIEVAGMNVKIMDLRDQVRRTRRQLIAADAVGDTNAVAVAEARLEQIGSEYETIRTATEMGGTEQAQAFVARQLNLNDDMDSTSLLGRWRSTKQAALTDAEVTTVQETVAESQKLETEVLKKERARNREVVNSALKAMKDSDTPIDSIESLNGRLKALLAANCDLE